MKHVIEYKIFETKGRYENSIIVDGIEVYIFENYQTFKLNEEMSKIIEIKTKIILSKIKYYIKDEIVDIRFHTKGVKYIDSFLVTVTTKSEPEDIYQYWTDALAKKFDRPSSQSQHAGNIIFQGLSDNPNRTNSCAINFWVYLYKYEMDIFNGKLNYMLSKFDKFNQHHPKFNEAKKVKKSPKKIAKKKAAKKTAKEYMLKKTKKVPSAIKSYSEMIFKAVEKSFDKWFSKKSLINSKVELTFNLSDILKEIPEKQFRCMPIEDIEVDLLLNTSTEQGKDFIESGSYKQISPDLIDFDLVSFKQTSGSEVVNKSYFLRFNFEITIPSNLVSIDDENFKERIRAVIYHEMAHAYDNILNSGISTARAHVVDASNLKLLSIACPAIHNLLYLIYISSPEEVYANAIGSYGFNSFKRYKKHWVYEEIQKLKKFKSEDFIKSIKEELPEDAVWESHDLVDGEILYYNLPSQFPKLFADYHDLMFNLITQHKTIRKDYKHDTYSNMRDMSLKEFSRYWEHEFNTAGEHYEDNIIKVINSKKKK